MQRLELEEGQRWFVARTQPHRETTAQFNLQERGFRVFVPRLQRTVRHARKLRNVLAPLFPGYVFVILDPSHDRWRAINATTGVSSLIMGLEQPMPVPVGVVEALIALRSNSGMVRLDHDLKLGQRVRILSGPFSESIGKLDQFDDRGRVRVLLEIMGCEVPALLDRSALAPTA